LLNIIFASNDPQCGLSKLAIALLVIARYTGVHNEVHANFLMHFNDGSLTRLHSLLNSHGTSSLEVDRSCSLCRLDNCGSLLTNQPEGSSPVNNATVKVRLVPYTESGFWGTSEDRMVDQYQAISAQQECANFSLEELRLADYEQGYGAPSGCTDTNAVTLPTRSLQSLRRTDDTKHGSHLDLYVPQ
jgi:hypothetical protein